MFEHFRHYPWVLNTFLYDDEEMLLSALANKVIGPAEEMARKHTSRMKETFL